MTYCSIFCFLFDRASFERFVEKHGWFLFPELLLSIMSFFSKYIFVRVLVNIDTKEMGNRDAIKVCVYVEIKVWFMPKSYYFIILVLRWKILYLILDNDLLLSRKQVFCLTKSKVVEAPIQVEFIMCSPSNTYKNIFCSTL